MPKNDIDSTSSSAALTGPAALLATGPMSLYTLNGFRVLGCPVDATDIELQEEHNKLDAYASLGKGRVGEVYTAAFRLQPPPSERQLDHALNRLMNDGEQRAHDEFFWFWPRDIGRDDKGLAAIAGGDEKNTLAVWQKWEQEPDARVRAIACHNLAAAHLLRAIEYTASHLAGTPQKGDAQMKSAWENAGEKWEKVADDRHVWEETERRVLSKGDPSLTADVARHLQTNLCKTLAAIRGDIAERYAQKALWDWAKLHIDAIATGPGYREVARTVTKPVRERLEAARSQTESYASAQDKNTKKQAFGKADDFLHDDFAKKARPVLDLFYTGDDELEKEKANIYDKVAGTVCDCCIATANAKQEAKEDLDGIAESILMLLDLTFDIATDPKLMERIIKNMDALKGTIVDPVLKEVAEVMNGVAKSKEPSSVRFRKLQSERPMLRVWAVANPGHRERNDILKAFAMLERNLSVDIVNTENDLDLAITAIQCAIEDTPDDTDKIRFQGDWEELKKIRDTRENNKDINELIGLINRLSEREGDALGRFRELIHAWEKFHDWADAHPRHEQCRPLMTALARLEWSLGEDISVAGWKMMPERNPEESYSFDPPPEAQELWDIGCFAMRLAIDDTPDHRDREKFQGDLLQLFKGFSYLAKVVPTPVVGDKSYYTAKAESDQQASVLRSIGNRLGINVTHFLIRTRNYPISRSAPAAEQVARRLPMALTCGITLLLLTLMFWHKYPSAWWWCIPSAGLVLGAFIPYRKGFVQTSVVYWIVTFLIGGVIAIHDASVAEDNAWGGWWTAPWVPIVWGPLVYSIFALVSRVFKWLKEMTAPLPPPRY
ncbi:MAG: hypothetical protein FWH21_00410 [Kiritimatiellaeota bacterium]|nr:hypothetical protein [Kiritimatiellota bacterium]